MHVVLGEHRSTPGDEFYMIGSGTTGHSTEHQWALCDHHAGGTWVLQTRADDIEVHVPEQQSATILASPTPTTTAFSVGADERSKFAIGDRIDIGGSQGTITALTTAGLITIGTALGSAPSAGTVIQTPSLLTTSLVPFLKDSAHPAAGDRISIAGEVLTVASFIYGGVYSYVTVTGLASTRMAGEPVGFLFPWVSTAHQFTDEGMIEIALPAQGGWFRWQGGTAGTRIWCTGVRPEAE